MVYIANSADVKVSGLHFLNSGFWNLHVYKSHDVEIQGLDIQAPTTSPSTDGMDIDSSQNITIHDCSIVNNDDGIALKGSKGVDAMDDKDSPPVEHIHVYDCVFGHTGSFVTCGSEATIIRDVEVDHCKAKAARGIADDDASEIAHRYASGLREHPVPRHHAGRQGAISAWRRGRNTPDLQGHAPPTHTVRNISISNITGTYGIFGSIARTPAM